MLGKSVLNLKSLVNVVVVTLAALTNLPANAAPAGAQLGTVLTGGDLTSGGTLSYQLNLTVTSPGAVVAKATIKAKHWKASFPVLSNSLTVGFATVSSDAISIPTNFHGTAVLQVKAKFGKRSIGSRKILVSISVPSTTPAAPQTTWYDVGFGSNVIVNADAVSTNSLTPPLTYAWSITDTDVRTNATFSSTTTNTPKFNTLPLTRFTNSLEVTSGGVTNVSDPVDLEKEFDLATNSNLVNFTSEQVDKSTYHLQVVVADAASHSATGDVTVISTSVSPGQPSIPIGERQYFTAASNGTNASTYSWSINSKPTGSTAILENPKTRTPSLRPDVEGDYVLQLTVTGGGQTNSSFVTVRGATYVGVATCASCHGTSPQVGLTDYFTPWRQTLHATMAQRGVDGLLAGDEPYNESCFACHTVGYNKSPSATNGNFYAVQQALGWKFPTVLQVGNYAAMPAALQDKANIACESCHGPGSQHPGKESANLDVAVCGQCHQENAEDNQRVEQWRLGPHGADDKYLSVSLSEAANPSCTKCHSPASFVDNLKGKALTRLVAGRLTCQACHDPHNVAQFPLEAHQVRVYDDVTLDDSVNPSSRPVLTGQGPSALCMYCHNARRSPPPTYSSANTLPHESTATDVLLGLRASTNVQTIVSGVTNTLASVTLENSAHAGVAKCVNCHMYKTGSNTFGDHTFSMTDRLTGEDNLAACNQCHAGVDPVAEFDHVSVVVSGRPHGGDYDGNGVTEGVQTEVDGVMTNLVTKMFATGMNRNGTGGALWAGYSTDAVVRAVQRNAAWNEFLIERELSHGVHNTAFTVRLLQWSYTVLSTNTGGNAYQVDFPNADLR